MLSMLRSLLPLLLVLVTARTLASPPAPPAPPALPPALPGDRPATFHPVTTSFDYDAREVMVKMRDGVRLKTFVMVPRGTHDAPMLLERTPYDAGHRTRQTPSTHLGSVLSTSYDVAIAAGYIVVIQDVRGKYGSEGDYVMTRPLSGALNPSAIDHATDTWDTIDWLVHNVPESNGRVATIGVSYGGFTTLMSVVHPHPALKAAIPIAPMVDGWVGDDWFHHGAFRQEGTLDYAYNQVATRSNDVSWWAGARDTYDEYLRFGSAGAAASAHGLEQIGFWRKLVEHPAYDAFWQEQAMDRVLAREPLKVPMLIVAGLFDQEDIYGAPALYRALAPRDPSGEFVHLVLGPWNHGQSTREGRELGMLRFAGDTSLWFRRNVMQPFLDHYLRDAPDPRLPRVLAYETGADVWHRYDAWPRACLAGCPQPSRLLYLLAGGRLGFEAPATTTPSFDEYVSDPAKPVPYRERPTLLGGDPDSTWGRWLADDQRFAASRTDVLVYETPPLGAPVRIAGQPIARLLASTSGTDSDWVIKLIDVYPDQVAGRPAIAGYQQMVSADVLRGRYRADPTKAQAIEADRPLAYDIDLPNADHTFLPGHRIMVQIQSTWFPLYDRNPQRFVANIFLATPEQYMRATQRIWRTAERASAIELPVIGATD